ncbi:glycosyl hydrolase 115 family protein [Sphingomonas qomolangmaensis]|uniref:Glycosyl hydrolase 115 family protein n=1 Tax=Sphingomonas qomolangmaensis TaxID=2918765 RepID=A0ABY5L6B2_9SPHN|nr:glycosyl hydrolase 115 family protein [Sphingomonas qomolangmaensis]UUL81209.1 glycosyl hydrolase 115 family protein [Sphingomonas qomolangmaensis]
MRTAYLIATAIVSLAATPAFACTDAVSMCDRNTTGALSLIERGVAARVVVEGGTDAGVRDAAQDLTRDLAAVAGRADVAPDRAVLIGVVGASPLVDRLIAEGKLDVSTLAGRWEGFVQQVVEAPMPGVTRALVIAGSDRRGAIFGTYDLSRRAGVSPWNWWADVPVATKASLFVTAGRRIDAPAVRYRGIFLNDEEPALGEWARTSFGGINAKFYERVFELTLRLKGNYLWPAMWGKSLWQDDPNSAALAQRMGIVLGTSHHEPMQRAHIEWERGKGGAWDYAANPAELQRFWADGIKRNEGRETVITVGMRGDGDEPMTSGTATKLLETIVADQRKILADVTGKPAEQTPQVWALYKEVQDYYDQGMRVPDDVTLLFADDNWGNIRRLPKPGVARPGGYGVYYHFDYVGGPRNYKWLNTNQISRTWEQMSLAAAHGVDRMWIVNVGDLKPMELPTSFFLDMAWDPAAMTVDKMAGYHQAWATEQFGAAPAAAIASILDRTTRYLARQKPELWSPDSWSLTDGTADRVLAEWAALDRDVAAVRPKVAPGASDAFYQLVEHPVQAAGNLARLYVTVARNRAAAAANDPRANALAAEAERLFAQDRVIRDRYETLGGGKWKHMMAQTHIGYTSWQQPDQDIMPEVRRVPAGSRATAAARPAATARPIEIDATAFAAVTAGKDATRWLTVPGLGITGAAVTPWPQTAPIQTPGQGPMLEYAVTLPRAGDVRIDVLAAPSLDVVGTGRRYAIAIDDAAPQVIDLWKGTGEKEWEQAVANGARTTSSTHRVGSAGRHRIRIWMIDPGVVIEQLRVAS